MSAECIFDFNFTNIFTLTKSMLNQIELFDTDVPNTIIKANITKGGEYPIIVVTGENATGKSFLRRIYQLCFREYNKGDEIECIHLSQQGRNTSGMQRVFIYGSEEDESTGQITSRTITTGVNTCKCRENKHIIIWDEPEIGLSDSYASGAGKYIREFVENLPTLTYGVIIITHCKYLIEQLLPINPHHLRLGDNKSLNEFIEEKVVPKDITILNDLAHNKWQQINEYLKK